MRECKAIASLAWALRCGVRRSCARLRAEEGAGETPRYLRELRCARCAAEEPVRDGVEKAEDAEDDEDECGFVRGGEEKHSVAVADGEESFDCIVQAAREEQGQDERTERNLEDASREDEYFERKGRRKNSGNEGAEEGVAIDPLPRFDGRFASVAMKIGFAALFREQVEPDAAGQRADRGHQDVVRHARGVAG